ncbi:MAG: ankyrin repeat domain-containing protein [Acidobacteriota bacterium]|nr:ankyrin repeat domain-containing protein [Acidobacteriota bacterium]
MLVTIRQQCVRLAAVGMLCTAWAAGPAAGNTDRQMVDAAKDRDWATVDSLLDRGVDADTPQGDGATALHWAAHWNDLRTVDRLIEAGANVNAANALGATPLWVACASRNTEVVERLLAAGADANRGLLVGETVLMRCTATGDPAAVQPLIEHGADVDATEPENGQTALMWAAAHRQPEVARVLLAHGAAVDARTVTRVQFRGTGLRSTTSPAGATYFDAGGFTPLLFAARHGDIDSARLLLNAGADVDDTGADGNGALALAAMSGHPRLAEFLLARGANPNADGAGYSALHAAVLRADRSLVRMLLAWGADPNARLTRSTPVPRWTYEFVFTLREKGATPFLLATKYLEPELARMIAAAGANPLARTDDGTTALMAAVGHGLSRSTTRRSRLIAPELVSAQWSDEDLVLETVKAAVDAGAADTLRETIRAGETALHAAARYGFTSVVDYLVGLGADLDWETEDGTTPRDLLEQHLARLASRD